MLTSYEQFEEVYGKKKKATKSGGNYLMGLFEQIFINIGVQDHLEIKSMVISPPFLEYNNI